MTGGPTVDLLATDRLITALRDAGWAMADAAQNRSEQLLIFGLNSDEHVRASEADRAAREAFSDAYVAAFHGASAL